LLKPPASGESAVSLEISSFQGADLLLPVAGFILPAVSSFGALAPCRRDRLPDQRELATLDTEMMLPRMTGKVNIYNDLRVLALFGFQPRVGPG
jgi:hypothetical protein